MRPSQDYLEEATLTCFPRCFLHWEARSGAAVREHGAGLNVAQVGQIWTVLHRHNYMNKKQNLNGTYKNPNNYCARMVRLCF